jgi:2-amino-4-hydroxy-6-hydroxymethyldihydropteridine diphosphokinase
MSPVYLLTGSNLGSRRENLALAGSMIESRVGKIPDRTGIYETEPWGFESETRNFYNQALLVDTSLTPQDLLNELLGIEREMGRVRSGGSYVSRKIDVDILFYDDIVIDSGTLVIPHPRMHKRRFALKVLAEIAPAFVHPVFKKDIATLLEECSDDGMVKRLDDNT